MLKTEVPILAHVAGLVGDPQVRHRGTIGGSLAHGDPASDLPAVVLALGGTLVAQGPGGERDDRRPPTSSPGFLETALAPDELLTEIRVPKVAGAGWSFQKFNRRALDWAIVGVRGGQERHHRGGAGQHGLDPAAGHGRRSRRSARAPRPPTPPGRRPRAPSRPTDLNASPEYRRHLAQVLVRRALEEAGGLSACNASRPSKRSARPSPATTTWRTRASPRPSSWPCGCGRPLLLEGEAGVGKTEVAKVLSRWTGGELLRLQCYEGIDAAQAVYEWDYSRQLLHLRAVEASRSAEVHEDELYSERFLVRRPLLRAIDYRGDVAARPPRRRGRPGRRRVRGLPARDPVRLLGHRARAGHVPRRRCRRWWCSPRTAPATSTTP